MSALKPYRVLSLDGGGIRGLYTACVLRSIAARYSKNEQEIDIGKGFDLIVGTSTGGILASSIAYGLPLNKVIELYQKKGPEIFSNPTPSGTIGLLAWATLKAGMNAANSNSILSSVLRDFFGDETMGSLWIRRQIALCLCSVNLNTHKARVFKTGHFRNKNADDGRLLVDVCLSTSAAPIIFPIHRPPDPDNPERLEAYVDGGLWANNPVLIGLVEALQNSRSEQSIEIISIGTCPTVTGNYIDSAKGNEGTVYWNVGVKALTAAMDAQANGNFHTAEFLAESLRGLGKECRILRLHESSPSETQSQHIGLDRAHEEAIAILMDIAAEDARTINGHINNDVGDYDIIDSIFSSLSKLEA